MSEQVQPTPETAASLTERLNAFYADLPADEQMLMSRLFHFAEQALSSAGDDTGGFFQFEYHDRSYVPAASGFEGIQAFGPAVVLNSLTVGALPGFNTFSAGVRDIGGGGSKSGPVRR